MNDYLANNIDFQKAIEESLIGFYRSTVDGKFLYANSKFVELLGYSNFNELLKLNIPKDIYISQEERKKFISFIKDKPGKNFIIRVKRKDGVIRDMLITGKLIDNRIIEGWMTDITDRIEEQRRLNIFSRIIEENPDAIFIATFDGKIIYSNEKFKKIVGESNVKYVKEVMPIQEGVLTKIKEIVNFIKEKNIWIGELEVVGENRKIIPVNAKIFSIKNKEGLIENFVSVFRDISKEKELEAQLIHSQKMEIIGTLASAIFHDLNNLLNSMGYNVELIKIYNSEKYLDKREKYLKNIETILEKANMIIGKIQKFSKKTTLTKEVISMKYILEEVKNIIFPLIDTKKNINVNFNVEKCYDFKIFAAKSTIIQVLMNIIINGIEAIEEANRKRGLIEVNCESIIVKDKSLVRIIVRDNGKGISNDIKEKIFEPFFTTKEKGTGLGLSFCIKEIKEMGGEVEVISEEGKGTSFVLILPLFTEKTKSSNYNNFHIKIETKPKNKTIMVIEDDINFVEILKDLLNYYGYNIKYVKNKKDFYKIIKENQKVDLILLDHIIDKNFYSEDVLKYLFKNKINIPIFLITGYMDEAVCSYKKYSNIKKILSKPISPKELIFQIEKFFYNSSSHSNHNVKKTP